LEWEKPLPAGRGVSSWTELAGGTAPRAPRKHYRKQHILGQRPGRRIGRGQGKRLWLRRAEKKGNQNQRRPQWFYRFVYKTESLGARLHFLIEKDGNDS